MEGERAAATNYDLQVSFSNTPQPIHELGFVHYEENQLLGFLSPSSQSQSLNSHVVVTSATTTAPTIGFMNHTKTWNNDQVLIHFPKFISLISINTQ